MKKLFISFLLAVVTLFAYGQNGPLKFLGIPIDGSEGQFASKLKAKGFTYNSLYECFKGQFNGKNVSVYIHTNHNLVDRIYVAFPSTRSKYSIKVEYNNLLSQFTSNSKYLSLAFNSEIPEDEDIAHEMLVNDKHYQASFSYFDNDRDPIAFVETLFDSFSNILSEEEIAIMKENFKKSLELPKEEQDQLIDNMMAELENVTEKQTDVDPMKSMELMFAFFSGMRSLADGEVWFTIHESYGEYNIGLYYDNLHNKAHGEDL